MDKKKIVNICLILTAILLYLVAAQAVELVFDAFNWNVDRFNLTESTGVFSFGLAQMIALAVAVVAYLAVTLNKSLMGYFYDAAGELSKVTYPTPKESGQSAIVVVVIVAVAALILTLFDSIWSFVTKWVLTS